MRKILLTVLSVIVAFSFYGCTEEETTADTTSPVVTRLNTTALDTEGSYFVINITNVSPVEYSLPVQGTTSTEVYEQQVEAAYEVVKNQGVYIKVYGGDFDTETIVINGNPDNGTITDATENNVLVLTSTNAYDGSYSIQVLLDARTAVAAKTVEVTVGNELYSYSGWVVEPSRIWTDEDGNEITSLYVKEGSDNGTNLISVPQVVPLYAYNSLTGTVVGPYSSNYTISTDTMPDSLLDGKFVVSNYVISEEDENTGEEVVSIPGCINNEENITGQCGITLYANDAYQYESDTLSLSFSQIVATSDNESVTVTSTNDLLLKGTKIDDVEVTSLASKYLDTTNSVAIFDIKAVNGGTLEGKNIEITGLASDGTFLQDGSNGNGATITSGYYIMREIETNSHYRVFINAIDAAYAAANGYLSIAVDNKEVLFGESEVMAEPISHAYLNGTKLSFPYKIGSASLTLDIKPTYFGPTPTYYEYSTSSNDSYTTSQVFEVGLSGIVPVSSTHLSVDNSTCSTIDNCSITVSVEDGQSISFSDYTSNGAVTIGYTNQSTDTNRLNSLPNTYLYFYTTETDATLSDE